MMRVTILAALLLLLAWSCVVRAPVTDPDPDAIRRYTIPLSARNQDLVCAQTLAALPDLCRSARSFRIWIMSESVEP